DDVTFNLADGSMQRHSSRCEPWNVTLLETGLHTMTGGRIKQAAQHLHGEPFMLTYGDGVANVDVDALLKFHQSHGRAITMTSIQPEGRFGLVDADQNDQVHSFREKPTGDDHWINGGFFVCQPEVLDAIPDNDPSCIFEQQPLRSLAEDGQMMTYRHTGFWQCMDTVRDRQKLVSLWDEGAAPWKVW
ncbi:MAG: sugar phosphate nucleotidyltransferase, partial [Planctomycetota bacterium]